MDQGTATVVAAGLGIGGTLAAGLIGPYLQARASRRQARDQEAVDVRHRLRDERRTAYATVLDQCEVIRKQINRVIEARMAPDWRDDADHRELWRPVNDALNALQRAATNVAITGPARMGELAHAMYDAAMEQANAWRMPQLGLDERAVQMGRGGSAMDEARREFVVEAQRAMAPPE